jgi:hypothetical protein
MFMIIKKPSIDTAVPADPTNLEEFYKIKLVGKRSFNYSLTARELGRLEYRQQFIQNLKGVVMFPSKLNDDAIVNKSMLEKYNPDLVYVNPGKGGAFGDSLGWISFICRLSEASGKTIKLARLATCAENIKKSILDTTGTYEIIGGSATFNLPGGTKGGYREVYSRLFLPAKKLWVPNNSKVVAVQFGKRGLADRRVQNPEDETRMIKALENKGYIVKQMGGSLGDVGCMELAAECEFFVGTCSGMSHLCHSVGTPVHMLTNNRHIERVSAGHVKNARSIFPTIFWQQPEHFIEYVKGNL